MNFFGALVAALRLRLLPPRLRAGARHGRGVTDFDRALDGLRSRSVPLLSFEPSSSHLSLQVSLVSIALALGQPRPGRPLSVAPALLCLDSSRRAAEIFHLTSLFIEIHERRLRWCGPPCTALPCRRLSCRSLRPLRYRLAPLLRHLHFDCARNVAAFSTPIARTSSTSRRLAS